VPAPGGGYDRAAGDAVHSLVDAAMPAMTRGLSRAREIGIDLAFGAAARRRRVALRQRRIAAFVIVGFPAVHVQANRIRRIVPLDRCRPYLHAVRSIFAGALQLGVSHGNYVVDPPRPALKLNTDRADLDLIAAIANDNPMVVARLRVVLFAQKQVHGLP
jgi:hypothetical protein